MITDHINFHNGEYHLSRSCGDIYCGTCSNYHYEKHRVCYDCHLHFNMLRTNSTFGAYKHPIYIALVYSTVMQIFDHHVVLMILNFAGFDDLIKSCGLDQQTLHIEGTSLDPSSSSITTSLMTAPIHTIMNDRGNSFYVYETGYSIDDNDINILVNEAHITDIISKIEIYNTSVTWNGICVVLDSITEDSTLSVINGRPVLGVKSAVRTLLEVGADIIAKNKK